VTILEGADALAGVTVGATPAGGAPTRGRGDAEMIWGAENPGRTDQFTPKQLPSARALDPTHSTIAGVSATAPEVDPQADRAGAQSTAPADARSAWRRRLAPAHRDAVKKFFAPTGGGKQ
jgi:hypothetical protein